MNNDGICADRFKYDKVIKVPMQDAGRTKFVQLSKTTTNSARGQPEFGAASDDAGERCALLRHLVIAPQTRQIRRSAKISRDHFDAGQATLCRCRLSYDGQSISTPHVKPRPARQDCRHLPCHIAANSQRLE